MSRLKLFLGLLAVGFLFVGAGCIETVEEGHVGVEKNWGAATGDSANPGLKIDPPGVSYHSFSTRQQLYVMSSQKGEGDNAMRDDSLSVAAKDDMIMEVNSAVVYKIDRTKAVNIYQNIGPMDAVTDRVRSKSRECILQAGSQFNGMEMVDGSSRVEFKKDAETCMKASLEPNHITVMEVQIRKITPPSRVKAQIQEKIAAEQKAEAMKHKLKAETLEAERKRIEAQGIRDSQEIIDETLTPEYIRYLWVTEGLEKGDVIYVPIGNDGQPVLTKDVDSEKNE